MQIHQHAGECAEREPQSWSRQSRVRRETGTFTATIPCI